MVWTKGKKTHNKTDMHKESLREVQGQKREAIVRGVLVADMEESMCLEH